MNKIKAELKSVKCLKGSDVVKQTALVTGITIIAGTVLLAFDTAIQYLISIIL